MSLVVGAAGTFGNGDLSAKFAVYALDNPRAANAIIKLAEGWV